MLQQPALHPFGSPSAAAKLIIRSQLRRRFPTPSSLGPPFSQLVGRRCTFRRMEERRPISQATEGLYLLKPTCGRQELMNVRVLRPAHPMSGRDYEHVLDLGPLLKRPPLGVRRFQENGFDFPTESQYDLRKDHEDMHILLGDQGRCSRAPPRAPPSDGLSPGSSSDGQGPPSWSRGHFRLDCSFPAGSSPHPPLHHHSSVDNARSAMDSPPPSGLPDLLRRDNTSRWPNHTQRKSCEYCRFRKKKCSGHATCARCFRIGIECVYMPDLIAKRMAGGVPEKPSPSPVSNFPYPTSSSSGAGSPMRSDTAQVSPRYPAYSCAAPSCLDDEPTETPTQPSGRGTKRRKRATNGKSGAAKRQKKLRVVQGPTQPAAFSSDQFIPCGDGPGPAAGDLGSAYVELALDLAGRVFGMAAGDTDSHNTEPRCINFEVLDRKIYGISVPKDWDTSKPQDVFDDTTTTQPGHTKDGTHVLQPALATTFGWAPQLEPSTLCVRVRGGGTVPTSGIDGCPLLGAWPSLEPLTDSSVSSSSPPSATAPPSYPAGLPDIANGHGPTESWTVDDWLAWYGSSSPS